MYLGVGFNVLVSPGVTGTVSGEAREVVQGQLSSEDNAGLKYTRHVDSQRRDVTTLKIVNFNI